MWSHSIDTASDLEDFTPNQAQPQNSTNPAGDRGNSSFDIRRRFTWNFNYEFPKMSGSLSRLKNGWGVDGVLNLQDGQPWQLNYEFEGDYSGAGEGFDRPDVIGPLHYSEQSVAVPRPELVRRALHLESGRPIRRTAARPTACRARGTSATWVAIRCAGPSFKEFNFSVFKNTAISERVNLQIRAEFFNLLQPPQLLQSGDAELYRRRRARRTAPPGSIPASIRSPRRATWASAIRSWVEAGRAASNSRPRLRSRRSNDCVETAGGGCPHAIGWLNPLLVPAQTLFDSRTC